MMEKQDFEIKTDAMRDVIHRVLSTMPLPYEVTIRPFKAKRSSAQNRLYWTWLSEITAQAETQDGRKLSREEWHHLCAMKFIGVKIIKVGDKEFPMPSKSTTKLKVDEFSKYLLEIESEFIPRGVQLTFPDDYGLAMGVKND